MKKALILLAIVALAVALPFAANWTGLEQARTVETVTVKKRTIETLTLASGNIVFGDERKLRPEVTARVEEVLVEEGDAVEQDQEVIRLDAEPFQAEVDNQAANVRLREIGIERAQVQIASMENQLRRQELLVERNVANADSVQEIRDQLALARVDLKARRQEHRQAQAALESARDKLEQTQLRAPITGIVSSLDINAGEIAISGTSANAALMTVADTSRTYADIEVDEADIDQVSTGQQVKVFAVAYPDTALTGEVETIALTARRVEGHSGLSFTVKVLINDTQGTRIRPGMSCRAEIVTASAGEQPALPLEAVQFGGDEEGPFVWLIENGLATRRNVTLGASDDQYQAIESGLSEGDPVISGPVRTVRALSVGDAVSTENGSAPDGSR